VFQTTMRYGAILTLLLLVVILLLAQSCTLNASIPTVSHEEQEAFFKKQFQEQWQRSLQEQQQGKRAGSPPLKLNLPGNGVLDPPRHHQRYRWSEYDKRHPYYQWWYYYVQDLEQHKHYAMSYGMTTCNGHKKAGGCQYEMAAVMFAMIDNKSGAHFQKYETFPMSHWVVDEDFHVRVFNKSMTLSDARMGNEEPLFELRPLSDQVIHLTGKMLHDSKNVWISEGIEPNAEIVWDITIDRVYGYYAQDAFEKPDEWISGIIMWDTYAHNSLVRHSKISIAGTVEYLDHDSDPTGCRFRAYGDGNWGQLMPDNEKHPDDKNYAWGWYLQHIPNKNPNLDVSVIAGTGRTYSAFPFYTMEGKFADVRINSTLHIEFREVVVYSLKLTSCNDGKLQRFNVQRTNWTTITDKFGSASIPLNQVTTMESENWLVVQDCQSIQANYNRLLFPFNNFVFSDFEGLGVTCRLTIKYKVTGQVIIDQAGIQSGIEYGFRYDVHNVPPLPFEK